MDGCLGAVPREVEGVVGGTVGGHADPALQLLGLFGEAVTFIMVLEENEVEVVLGIMGSCRGQRSGSRAHPHYPS